ncbi:MAG: hypothetical protein JST89_13575 [Cyanobacteria bacterium SZAS-4]|nr:hypothetical protein [Cyanobacteria bacterium SZAS-4]
MALNSAAESFEGRNESSQKFTTALSTEALFTQGGNDLYKKAVSASMNFASTCDLPSCDDLLKQLNDTKTHPLYDKTEKGAKPADDEVPKLHSWDEATKGKKPADHDAPKHHKSDDGSKHHKTNDAHNPDERVRDAKKIDRLTHANSWDDVAKKANEVQHKIAEHARKDPDVVKVTESKKTGEKIETVTVEKKDGSKIVYGPTGETKHYPARHLPGNAALEDWLE